MKDFKVLPFADIYPMLPEDELAELADDIRVNGLVNPIIVKGGVLIDGRNRLAACKIAGVKPVFVEHEGDGDDDSLKTLVISLNNSRRHLSKGQKAMAVAMAYPEAGHKHKKSDSKIEPDIHRGLLSNARKVLKHLPAIAKKVMEGATPLSEAYKMACNYEDELRIDNLKLEEQKKQQAIEEKARIDAQGDEEKRLELMRLAKAKADADYVQSKIEALRIADQELGEAVNNGALSLSDAEKILAERQEQQKALELTAKLCLRDIRHFHSSFIRQENRLKMVKAIKSQLTGEDTEAIDFMVRFYCENIINTKTGE